MYYKNRLKILAKSFNNIIEGRKFRIIIHHDFWEGAGIFLGIYIGPESFRVVFDVTANLMNIIGVTLLLKIFNIITKGTKGFISIATFVTATVNKTFPSPFFLFDQRDQLGIVPMENLHALYLTSGTQSTITAKIMS